MNTFDPLFTQNNGGGSSIGMYVDTSGVRYTNPIQGLENLTRLRKINLIFGIEATQYTDSKDIQIGNNIIAPYNAAIMSVSHVNPAAKWEIFSSSLLWIATATQNPDQTIANVYLSKIPFNSFAEDGAIDNYNFLTGLEEQEALKDVPSNTVFNKVIKTKYGYHVVFVKENDNNQQWSVEHILIVPYPSEKTVAEKLEKLNKVKADIEAGTLVLNDKIDEDVIQSFDAKGITADGVIPNFVYSPEIGKAVYNSELNKVGILKPNKATIVVFQKTKETKAEDNGFDKLKEEIKSDYINNKVAEYMSKLF